MAAPATTKDRAPGDGYLVLWAGSTEVAERDAQVELRRAGTRVEIAGAEELAERASARAPDLVVLGGELADDPAPSLRALAARSAAVPVIALVPAAAASPRPRARYGLVARFDRDLAPPALASQIAALLEGLSTRPPVWRVSAKPGDVAPLAARFASSGRSGILSVGGGAIAVQAGVGIAPSKLVIPDPGDDGDRSLSAYFHERPADRVRTRATEGDPQGSLEEVRVLVIDEDAERRERTTRRLEARGAQVRATGLVAQAVHAGRALDPAVVVIAADALSSSAVAPVWNEPRLAAAALLVLDGAALDDDAIASQVFALAEVELALGARLREGQAIAERLETLGPARWLKLLGQCEHDVTVRVFAATGRARVDLAGGRIQGASFRPRQDETQVVDGRGAVDALMAMPFGRVLAGPPDALAALEGVSAKRKPSMVGRIEPTPPSGVRRKQGLVAKEIVVKRTDATGMPSATPSATSTAKPRSARPPAETLPETEGPPPVTIGDLAEGNDHETSTYAPETLEALRAELASPPPAALRAELAPTPETPAALTDEEARAELLRLAEPEPIASPEPALPPLRVTVSTASAAPPPIDAPILTTQLAPVTEVPLAPRARSNNGVWYAAGLALALGAGGLAAWKMKMDAPAPSEPAIAAPSEPVVAAPTEPAIAAPSEPVIAEPVIAESEAVIAEPVIADPSDAVIAEPPVAAPSEPALAEPAIAEPVIAAPPVIAEPAIAEPEPAPADDAETTPVRQFYALVEAAREAGRAGDYALSEQLSRQALTIFPRNSQAGYRLAVALFHLDRFQEALDQCEETARWDEQDPLPHALIGDIHSRRGRFTAAARAYRRALEARPGYPPAERALERLAARGVE